MAATAAEALNVTAEFAFDGRIVSAVPYGSGHINDTFLTVTEGTEGQRRFILQRINHQVFKQPDLLMENVARVCAHAHAKLMAAGTTDAHRRALRLIPTHQGKAWHVDQAGNRWRCYDFIEGATGHDVVRSPAQAEAALAGRIAEIQSSRRRHQFAGLGAFLTALALGAYLGLADTPVASLLGQAAGVWSKEDPKVTEQTKRLEADLRTFEKLRAEAAAAVRWFFLPRRLIVVGLVRGIHTNDGASRDLCGSFETRRWRRAGDRGRRGLLRKAWLKCSAKDGGLRQNAKGYEAKERVHFSRFCSEAMP